MLLAHTAQPHMAFFQTEKFYENNTPDFVDQDILQKKVWDFSDQEILQNLEWDFLKQQKVWTKAFLGFK